MNLAVRGERARLRIGPMVGACAALLLAGLALQLLFYRHGGHEAISDLPRIVLHRRLARGTLPYVDRMLEYPVLSGVLAYLAVSIWSSPLGALLVTAAGASVVALALTALLGRRFGARAWRWALATPVLLYAFQNWDLFAIAALVVGLLAFERGKDATAGVAFGIGAAVKLFPIVVVPPLAALRWARGDRRGARRLAASAFLVVVTLNLPVVLANAGGWWWPYRFQSGRQATWGSVWFYVVRMSALPAHGVHGAAVANAITGVAAVAALAWLVAVTMHRHLDPFAAACAAVAIFVLCNKVYSPTYDLWLVAFFVMVPLSRRLWILFCAVDLAVFATVYGYFDGPLAVGTLRTVLPVLVIMRTAVLCTVIARATQPPRTMTAPIRTDEESAPNERDASDERHPHHAQQGSRGHHLVLGHQGLGHDRGGDRR